MNIRPKLGVKPNLVLSPLPSARLPAAALLVPLVLLVLPDFTGPGGAPSAVRGPGHLADPCTEGGSELYGARSRLYPSIFWNRDLVFGKLSPRYTRRVLPK